jgi:ferredoxin-NADP reductase
MKFETKIQEIIQRTPDVASYRFSRPAELTYKPGQYFFVNIKQGDKELSHHFSFSSSPTENNFIEFTKKFTDHEYSVALKASKVGDWARIDAPYGKFTFEGEFPKIALLAGGIGITPLLSICKNATDKHLDSKITLFYGNRSENDIAFRDEFEAMQEQNKNLKIVHILNQPSANWKGLTGFVTADLIRNELPDFKENIFYCCGPPGMVTAMQSMFKSLGLLETQLKLEYFVGYT